MYRAGLSPWVVLFWYLEKVVVVSLIVAVLRNRWWESLVTEGIVVEEEGVEVGGIPPPRVGTRRWISAN